MKIEDLKKLSFGPVPSRRLGRSLGINNIPAKVCSYACVYCQLGKTLHNQIERTPFYAVDDLVLSAKMRIEAAKEKNETIDYLAFVPDGEPTLDMHLGDEIDALHKFGIKIAVISNASLIWREDVRKDLCKADWVSLKVDAATELVWHKVDRANKCLKLDDIQKGMIDFKSEFQGFYATETMLVEGVNDSKEELEKIAAFLQWKQIQAWDQGQQVEVKESMEIFERVYSTGEMGPGLKEQSLIIRTLNGMVIITGCAHPGVVNIVKRAKEMFDDEVLLVMGGFHLINKSRSEVDIIISNMKKLGVRYVGPCHCTGDKARKLFQKVYREHFISIGVGKRIDGKDLK